MGAIFLTNFDAIFSTPMTFTLHQGDCLELMRDIPDASVDLILCDLPYGTTACKWDCCVDLAELWIQYLRVIKRNGAIVLTSQGIFTARLILSAEKIFKYKVVWEKSKSTNFLNAKKQPLRKHEDICVFYKAQPNYYPQMSLGKPYNKGIRKDQQTDSYGNFSPILVQSEGDRYPTDIVYFKTAESEGAVLHPTQKPVALMEYLIRTYTNVGDTVMDNCMGSGSTGVACVNTGRDFIGIERDPGYFEIATRRINEAAGLPTIGVKQAPIAELKEQQYDIFSSAT